MDVVFFKIFGLVLPVYVPFSILDYALEEEQADVDIIEKARGTHDGDDDNYFVKDPKKALKHYFETAGLINNGNEDFIFALLLCKFKCFHNSSVLNYIIVVYAVNLTVSR